MRKSLAIIVSLFLVCMSISGVAAAAAPTAQPEANCSFYQETQHNLCGGFRAYWEMYGGVAVFGFPITEEYVENGMTVQYFERARFEWHPGEWPERYDVMLGLLGNTYATNLGLTGTAPFAPMNVACMAAKDGDCMAFPETGHKVSGKFLDYWNANGGLAIFGYPISDQFTENGHVVQYFERERMELHPENAGTPYAVLLGLLGTKIFYGPTLTAVAQGLNNPRGVAVSENRTVYVAEAGSGGNGLCIPSDEGGDQCFGTSGAITKIANGTQSQLVTGLPSLADAAGMSALGPASVATFGTGRISAVIQGAGTPEANAQFGEDGALLGHLITIDNQGQVTDVADLGAYEATNNPDGQQIDSDPYAVLDLGNKWIVADAAANDLLQVTADGTISTLAVFPSQMVDAPPFLNMPAGTQIPAESVPTSVTIGPDGAYYVGELTGFPFPVGGARVWRVVPGQQPAVYATGFTNIISVTFDANGNMLVLEIAKNGLLAAEAAGPDNMAAAAGALIRVLPDGTQHEVASAGLVMPGGVAVGPDGTIYVSNFGIFSGMGAVVRLDY